MAEPETYSLRRYLDAKRSVDERALNRHVVNRLRSALRSYGSPLRILEVGVGIGATIERVATWDTPHGVVEYTGVDKDPALIEAARERLSQRSNRPTFESTTTDGRFVSDRSDRRFVVELVERDIFEYVANADRHWDLLIGQAFMDLYEVKPAVSRLCTALDSRGLLYFPITFDGATILEPPTDPEFDDVVRSRYHEHMDGVAGAGSDHGDSRAGRHLLTAVPELDGSVIAAGNSDWVVVPDEDGYPADEAYFLHHIIDTIRGALDGNRLIDSDRFDRWVDTRHSQIENHELVYIAHQLDVLCRGPP